MLWDFFRRHGPLVLAVILLLVATGIIGYLLFSRESPVSLIGYGAGAMGYGAGVERPELDKTASPKFTNCNAIVVSGVTLDLSKCTAPRPDTTYFVSLSVTIPASLSETVKTVLSNAIGSRKVSCDAAHRCTAFDENTNLDLNLMLLETGLAITQHGEEDSYAKVESAARSQRRGLWWDWSEARPSKSGYPNPILWRGERDLTSSNADTVAMSRVTGIGTFITGVLSFALGGFFFQAIASLTDERKKQRDALTIAEIRTKELIDQLKRLSKDAKRNILASDINKQIEKIKNLLSNRFKPHMDSVEKDHFQLFEKLREIWELIDGLIRKIGAVSNPDDGKISDECRKQISEKLKPETLKYLETLKDELRIGSRLRK